MNRILALAALATLSAAAQATTIGAPAPDTSTVINFNDDANNIYWVPTVTSDGYKATELVNEDGTPLGTNVAIDGYGTSNGTVHLDSWTNDGSDSVWSLTNASGAAFSLKSFDFGSGYPGNDEAVSLLTVTGHRADGSTVTETFTPADQSFETLTLNSSFSWLSSVTFDAYGPGNRAAYDNISVSSVPEPSMAALLALGLGGMFIARRKRQA